MEKILPVKTDVRGFRLVNGDEIIAEVIRETDEGVQVSNVLRVITGFHEGSFGINIIPYSLITPVSFVLKENMYGSSFPLTAELESQYNQHILGLVAATSSTLLQG